MAALALAGVSLVLTLEKKTNQVKIPDFIFFTFEAIILFALKHKLIFGRFWLNSIITWKHGFDF